ncbi:MAG: hypothetical protein ABEJ08_00070 [Halobacteriaceae archaeon]
MPAGREAWVYESLVGAVPGLDVTGRTAAAVQFAVFEAGVLVVGGLYGLERAVVAGTVAVAVAATGSAFMLDLGRRLRSLDASGSYVRLVFGTRIEVVLGLLAYVALLTYLFVLDPRWGTPLFETLLGPEPPLVAAYLLLLILWDVCYRIGTGWWAAVTALWRTYAGDFDDGTAAALRVADRRTIAFGLVQLALVPPVLGHPVLVTALLGHVVAVLLAAGLSVVRLRRISPT